MAYTVLRVGTILVFLSIVIVSEVSLFAKLILFFIGMLIVFLFNNSLLTKESISKQAKIALYSSMAVIAFFYIMAFFLAESASVVSFFSDDSLSVGYALFVFTFFLVFSLCFTGLIIYPFLN